MLEDRKEGRVRKPRLQKTSSQSAWLASSHQLAVLDREVWCTCCFSARRRADHSGLAAWLRAPCPLRSAASEKLLESDTKPVFLGSLLVAPVVGRQPLHATHLLWRFAGLWFCEVCGAVACLEAQNLAQPCPGAPRSRFAQQLAQKLRTGKCFPKTPGVLLRDLQALDSGVVLSASNADAADAADRGIDLASSSPSLT